MCRTHYTARQKPEKHSERSGLGSDLSPVWCLLDCGEIREEATGQGLMRQVGRGSLFELRLEVQGAVKDRPKDCPVNVFWISAALQYKHVRLSPQSSFAYSSRLSPHFNEVRGCWRFMGLLPKMRQHPCAYENPTLV